MESFLTRYRNLTVLLVVVLAQLLYLAYQIKTNHDDRLIRVWAVSAVTPMAGGVEAVRRNTIGFLQDYFILLDVRDQNRKLKSDNDKLRLENIYFRNQLSTAQNAIALSTLQTKTKSKTVSARVIGNSTVATAKAVFIDRGSTSGIERGMSVVTPEGIVGKIVSVYPLTSQVLLVTDPTFKVGIESQKNHVHGVLNCGSGHCVVEQIQDDDKVESGEWFFTSGEDRIFPRGFPVGVVLSNQPGAPGMGMRDVKFSLSGAPGAAQAVLVILDGVHQDIPAPPTPVAEVPAKTLAQPPSDNEKGVEQIQTSADRLVEKYREIGKDQNHKFGAIGSNVPDFNPKPATPPAPAPTAAPAQPPAPAKPAPKQPELPLGSPKRTSPPQQQ